ncbi:cupin domain-containing protein [Purpureocillium lavendulum]|uniref:Cupin domain-containing protein n=1 Tax=Purpureocillium lavendulum TaxID=1247861 RepID=A0AB34FXT4_9HYPO|nr:cupin domain-containing protein [Purpureocillium lavendulum]
MGLKPTTLSALRVSRHDIPAWNMIPNTSIQNRPLLIYHGAFPSTTSPSAVESHLSRVGVVEPQWRFTMYDTTHFHSNTHEVLCVTHGRARLCFGGEENPGRVEPVVEAGDVMVVPAGVGHRLLEDMGPRGFQMVGSYPVGAPSWDMCYGRDGEEAKLDGIRKLGWLERDPIYGDEGPVLDEETRHRGGQDG